MTQPNQEPPRWTFSREEKRHAISREIGMRKKVYPGLVRAGRMAQADAERQIQVMEAILADYEDPAAKAQTSMF